LEEREIRGGLGGGKKGEKRKEVTCKKRKSREKVTHSILSFLNVKGQWGRRNQAHYLKLRGCRKEKRRGNELGKGGKQRGRGIQWGGRKGEAKESCSILDTGEKIWEKRNQGQGAKRRRTKINVRRKVGAEMCSEGKKKGLTNEAKKD